MEIKIGGSNFTYTKFFKEHWFEEINHRFKLQIFLCFSILVILVLASATQRKLKLHKTNMTMKEGTFYFYEPL